MRKIAVIPARYDSTRLPGKPLLDIAGKPMIQHVYERVLQANLDDVIIACDDTRVFEAVKEFNANVIMTRRDHLNGSSRIAEVLQEVETDIVINVQGDEPLINPEAINQLVDLLNDSRCLCATLKSEIIDVNEINDPNTVKVITDINDNAIYFSRFGIPYLRNNLNVKYYKHIGIYGYKKDFLMKYVKMDPSMLEISESLEQLRILENGFDIKVLETEFDFIGVDTYEDLEKVRNLLL